MITAAMTGDTRAYVFRSPRDISKRLIHVLIPQLEKEQVVRAGAAPSVPRSHQIKSDMMKRGPQVPHSPSCAHACVSVCVFVCDYIEQHAEFSAASGACTI